MYKEKNSYGIDWKINIMNFNKVHKLNIDDKFNY